MKIRFILPLVLLTACASQPKLHVRAIPGTVLTSEGVESVRYSENIKAYPIGRYIDPNDTLVMHERHTVYRVETTAKWNLHPNASVSVSLGPVTGIVDPARYNAPINAEVLAEVNKQKTATQTLIEQGAKLDQTLSQLSGAFLVTKQLGDQQQQLRTGLTTAQKRLDALEQELRKKQTDTFVGSNQNTKDQW